MKLEITLYVWGTWELGLDPTYFIYTEWKWAGRESMGKLSALGIMNPIWGCLFPHEIKVSAVPNTSTKSR